MRGGVRIVERGYVGFLQYPGMCRRVLIGGRARPGEVEIGGLLTLLQGVGRRVWLVKYESTVCVHGDLINLLVSARVS